MIDQIQMENKNLLTENIVSSIMELTEKRKYIYNPKNFINMRVLLYETDEESILYLSTDDKNDSHPYSRYVSNINISFEIFNEREETVITDNDLKFPKGDDAIVKLKDLLKKSFDPNIQLSVKEIMFLQHMNNYWAFSWNDLMSDKSYKHMNVYVFKSRTNDPDINILAKDLIIYSYDISSKQWKGLRTSNFLKTNTFFTRYSSLVNLYRNFDFSRLEEFKNLDDFDKRFNHNPFDINGIIMVKGSYNPRNDFTNSMHENLLLNDNTVLDPIKRNILIKKFGNTHSKGNQTFKDEKSIVDKKDIIKEIEKRTKDKIYLYFFLYDSWEIYGGRKLNIFDFKKREVDEMKKAMEGSPTLRFKIEIIEKNIENEDRKKEIYKMIYKVPFELY